jgi:regulator of protease activity HflC (stomatin/prohibitin superfamily)
MVFIGLIVWWFIGYPSYRVWEQGKHGEAELARAEQNRQIRIAQAKAELESAKLTAQAEVERAKGVAEANKIMVGTLGTPENYLRWRYIHMLEESKSPNREVIYVPSNGFLPELLEAGRGTKH